MTWNSWDSIAGSLSFNLEIDKHRLSHEVSLNAKILDFGCGYGRITNELAVFGYKNIIGIDPSVKMIERGSQMYPELSLQHLQIQTLPYKDEAFDAVVSCAVFTCIVSDDDRMAALSEIYRVLKPSGLFHIAEFCSERTKAFTSSFGIGMRYSSPKEYRAMLRPLVFIHEQVCQTQTMSGTEVLSYRAFVKKPLDKSVDLTSR
jgi:ubiquinone/menaquinone biosynthesis C-methylase UbiE